MTLDAGEGDCKMIGGEGIRGRSGSSESAEPSQRAQSLAAARRRLVGIGQALVIGGNDIHAFFFRNMVLVGFEAIR